MKILVQNNFSPLPEMPFHSSKKQFQSKMNEFITNLEQGQGHVEDYVHPLEDKISDVKTVTTTQLLFYCI